MAWPGEDSRTTCSLCCGSGCRRRPGPPPLVRHAPSIRSARCANIHDARCCPAAHCPSPVCVCWAVATTRPSVAPTAPTIRPSVAPTVAPTTPPTRVPTSPPTVLPTRVRPQHSPLLLMPYHSLHLIHSTSSSSCSWCVARPQSPTAPTRAPSLPPTVAPSTAPTLFPTQVLVPA